MIACLRGRGLAIGLGMIAALSCAPGRGADAPADRHDWKIYANVRYRYQICYPADLLKPQGEADDSDGQSFKGIDGGMLSVFGRNNVDGASLAQTARQDAADLTGKAGRISYHVARPDWEVVSGDDGGTMDFYSKTFRRGDQFAIFELRYPKSAQARYAPVVTRLSRCFALAR